MKRITLLCVLLIACFSWQGYAQTTPICGGKFYDTGGPTGDFQNNENYTVTILPSVTGNLVTATFTFVDNTSWDELKVDIGDGNGFVLVPYDIDPANDPPVSYTSAAADGSLVFEFISSSVTQNPGWEADITCNPPPTCLQPIALTAANILPTSADLGWTEADVATTWDLEVVTAGTTPTGTPTDTGVTSNPYNKTGLTAQTDYEFYVRADCGATDGLSLWSGPFAFTTACLPFGDFYENFDTAATSGMPNCWTTLINSTASASTVFIEDDSGDAYSGTNYLEFYDSSGDTGDYFAITPELTALSAGTHQMRFYAKSDATATIEVGTMTDPTDATTFTVAQTITLTTSYAEYIVPFSTTTTDLYVAFKGVFTATYDYIEIDDVNWEPIPSCSKPSFLTATNITDSATNLGWTENGTAPTWDIEVVTAGTTPTGTPTDAGVTSNPYNKTGLTAQTDYEFYVRADCGATDGLSIWSGPYAFTTACAPVTTPWLDDVEAHPDETTLTESNCWTASSTTSYDWNVEANGSGNSSSTGPDAPHSGAAYFYVEASSGSQGDVAELYTPLIDLTGLTTPSLQFYYHMYGQTMGELHVDIHDGTAWINDVYVLIGEQQTADTDPWLQAVVDLTPYTGTIQVRFRAIRSTDYYGDISLDDIEVKNGPTCFPPATLTATNITPTSASLGWNSSATTWDIEVVAAGTAATGTPTEAGVTTNPFNKTGLTDNTAYEFYVRADCGGGDLSNWSGPFAFTTPCLPFGDFSENFDTAATSEMPDCWTTLINSTSSSSTIFIEDDSGDAYSGSNYLEFYDSSGDTGDYFAITPQLTALSAGTHQMRFYAKSDATATIEVGTMTDPTDATTFTVAQTITLTTSYAEYIVPFSTTTTDQYVAFKGVFTATYDYIEVDDVNWEPIPSCPKPSSLTATNITDSAADLGWADNAGTTTWDVHVVLTGDPAPDATTTPTNAGVTTNPFNVTGLTANTAYEFYVRTDCGGGDLSIWAGPFAFTTLCVPATIPYSESFASGTFPSCWSRSTTADVTIEASCGSRSNVLRIDQAEQAVTAIIDASTATNGLMVSYDIADSVCGDGAESGEIFNVDYWDGTQWVNAKSYDAARPDVFTSEFFYVPQSAVSNGFKVRFDQVDGTTDSWLIDNVTVDVTPSCMQPTALTATNITNTSADLGWTENGTATTWDIEVVTAGTTPTGTPTDAGVTSTTYTPTGLSQCVTYAFYVRADCGAGDTSTWSGPFEFSLTGTGIITPPYTQDFATFLPNCWEEADGGDVTTGPTTLGSGDWTYEEFLNTGTNQSANINIYNNGDESWLISPSFDLSAGAHELTYMVGVTNYNNSNPETMGSDDEAQVLITTDNGTTWTNLQTYNQANSPSETGTLEIIDLTAYSGTAQLAFWVTNGTVDDPEDYDFFIDDFDIHLKPNCAQPTALTATNLMVTSADLGWTDNNTPAGTMWDIHVVLAGDPAPTASTTSTDPGVTANPYNKTGLLSGTVYEFYVRTDCGTGASAWAGPFAFATACATTTLPYMESFSSGTFPPCWTRSSDPDVIVETSCGSRNNVLRFDNSEQAITAEIDASGVSNGLQVSYYIADSVCGDAADAGEMFNVDYWDGAQWVNAKTYDAARPDVYTYEFFFVPQSDVSTTFKVRFDQIDGTTDSWMIDEVEVIEAPTCIQPTALTATNILATSVDLGWTVNNTPAANMWDLEVVTAGTTPTGTPTDVGVTTNPYNKTGLTADTNYEFYVRADCGGGDTSPWSGPYSFFTACTPATLPYLESFSGGTFPNCWDRTSTSDVTVEATCDSRSNVLNISDTNDVTTAAIDISMATNGVIVSYYIGDDLCGGATEDPFNVSYWDGTQWVNAKTYETVNDDEPYSNAYLHDNFIVPASAISANFQVRFSAVETINSDNWYIDEFAVEMPPCYEPSNIAFNNITQTQADVSWMENGVATEWEIEYGATGFTPGSGTMLTDNDGTLGETIPGLTAATVYDVYVRSLCTSGASGNTSGWVGPVSFTTACDAITTFPYTESFEASSGYRPCWTMEYVSGSEDWGFVAANQNGTIAPKTGASMAQFMTTNPGGVDVTKFVSPALDLSNVPSPQLKFYYANVSWMDDIDELRVYYKTSATGTWTQIGTDYTAEQTAWTEVVLNLPNPSADYYVAFEGTSYYGRGLNVDDVSIEAASCPDPSDIAVSNILTTTADISWTENGSATEWEIEYGANGFTPGDGTGTIVADNDGTLGETLTGLIAETSYDVYVTAICGPGDESNQVGPETFTTAPLGVNDQVFEGFTYYPNPVNSQLSLKATTEIQEVVVYDLLGQEVLKSKPNSLAPTLEFHNLQAGTYLMKVTIDGSVGVYRIIKE